MHRRASSVAPVRYRQPEPVHIDALARFFAALVEGGDQVFFHPHPLTREEAADRASYRGRDLYYLQFIGDSLSGYGMLRGWDAGYEIPSLGVAIHPEVRGQGLAEDFLRFLHAVARQRGAPMVRLTVHGKNTKAVQLYRRLGYRLRQMNAEVLEGRLVLGTDSFLAHTAGKPVAV